MTVANGNKQDLPLNWEYPRLGDVISLEYGKALPERKRLSNGNVPVFGSSGIVGYHDKAITARESLIVGRKGSIGSVYLSNIPCWPIDTTYFIYSPSGIDLKFLFYYLFYSKLGSLDKSTAIPGLNRNDAYSLIFPLSPYYEQRRIVAKVEELFSCLDASIEALQKAKVQLKRYRQAVLKAAVEGRLTEEWRKAHPDAESSTFVLKRILDERRAKWEEKEITKLIDDGQQPKNDRWKQKYNEPIAPEIGQHPLLPEGWVWATIEQLASSEARSIQSGPFGSTLHHSEFQNKGVLAIGIDNVLDGRFSMGKEHCISLAKFEQLRKYSARPLDVLITVMATVGRCCVVPVDFKEAIITKHVYRISVNQSFVNSYYLMYCLLGGSEIREQIFKKLRGQTRPGINGAILKQIAIPVPPLKEQLEIVAEIERILSIDDSIESMVRIELKLANRLRQSILKRAFDGKLVPQNPSDEPASILLERIKAERAKQSLKIGKKNIILLNK